MIRGDFLFNGTVECTKKSKLWKKILTKWYCDFCVTPNKRVIQKIEVVEPKCYLFISVLEKDNGVEFLEYLLETSALANTRLFQCMLTYDNNNQEMQMCHFCMCTALECKNCTAFAVTINHSRQKLSPKKHKWDNKRLLAGLMVALARTLNLAVIS